MKKKKGRIKAVGAGLEGFVEWVDSIASDPAKEREDDMSSLAVGFAAEKCKRAASAQGETIPGSKVYGRKCSRRSGPHEEAQKSSTVINMDSLE